MRHPPPGFAPLPPSPGGGAPCPHAAPRQPPTSAPAPPAPPPPIFTAPPRRGGLVGWQGWPGWLPDWFVNRVSTGNPGGEPLGCDLRGASPRKGRDKGERQNASHAPSRGPRQAGKQAETAKRAKSAFGSILACRKSVDKILTDFRAIMGSCGQFSHFRCVHKKTPANSLFSLYLQGF